MIGLKIYPDGEGAFEDWTGREFVRPTGTLRITGLAGGCVSGAPSVGIGVELPDGRVLFAETSLRLFLVAADVLRFRHGDPRADAVDD